MALQIALLLLFILKELLPIQLIVPL